MIYQVDVQSEVVVPDQIDQALKTAASITLTDQNVSSAALSILLTDDDRMQKLNHDFRGINKTTDVLSFPFGSSELGNSEALYYLGDIAISMPVATNQAKTTGHSVEAELQLLVVHGVLHLLEYDHVLAEDKVLMWSVQEKILLQLGLHNITPTEA